METAEEEGRRTRAGSSPSNEGGESDHGHEDDSTSGGAVSGASADAEDNVEETGARTRVLEELRAEVATAQVRATGLETELERVQLRAAEEATRLQQEVSQLRGSVRSERERYSALWRMNCERLAEFDEIIATKEEENDRLRSRIAELEAVPHPRTEHLPVATAGPHTESLAEVSIERDPPVHGKTVPRATSKPTPIALARPGVEAVSLPSRSVHEGRPRESPSVSSSPLGSGALTKHEGPRPRRGKAPPVDSFTGESPGVLFDD